MARRTWNRIGAAGIALGLASFIAAAVIQWMLPTSGDSPIGTIVADPGIWTLVSILAVFGPLAWAVGMLVTMLAVEGRGWVLTTIGALVSAIGFISGVGHLGLFFGLWGDLAAAVADPDTARAVMAADGASAVSTAMLLVFLAGFTVGPVLLTLGLRRARMVGVWVPVAAVVAGVAGFAPGVVAGIVQLVALLAVFIPLIALLVRDARVPQRAADERVPAL
jgi:hypothetical protein